MKNIELNELKSLTVITGNSFTDKTALLDEILEETSGNSKYVNIDSSLDIKVNDELKHFYIKLYK